MKLEFVLVGVCKILNMVIANFYRIPQTFCYSII